MNDIDIDSPVIDVNNYDEAMSYYKENGYVILTIGNSRRNAIYFGENRHDYG